MPTPMAWANASNGGVGHAGVTPWLPVNPDYAHGTNVNDQKNDPDSPLSFYKKMLHIRKDHPALIWDDYRPIFAEATDYLAFLRISPQQKYLVILNMSEKPQSIQPTSDLQLKRVIFSSQTNRPEENKPGIIQLAPFEIFIAEAL